MENPFELIMERLISIENLLIDLKANNFNSQTSKPFYEIMTIQQLSEYLNLSKSHIYKKTSSLEIPHSKRGKKLYFEKSVID